MPTFNIIVSNMYTIEASSKAKAEEEALNDARHADDSEIVSCQRL